MIRISASFSKKVPGIQQYSSDAVHLGVEIELPESVLRDPDEFKRAVRRLFAQARAEVEEQVGSTPNLTHSTRNVRGDDSMSRRNDEPASPRQIDFLLSLGRRNGGMSEAAILRDAGVEKLTDLTRTQASALISRFSRRAA